MKDLRGRQADPQNLCQHFSKRSLSFSHCPSWRRPEKTECLYSRTRLCSVQKEKVRHNVITTPPKPKGAAGAPRSGVLIWCAASLRFQPSQTGRPGVFLDMWDVKWSMSKAPALHPHTNYKQKTAEIRAFVRSGTFQGSTWSTAHLLEQGTIHNGSWNFWIYCLTHPFFSLADIDLGGFQIWPPSQADTATTRSVLASAFNTNSNGLLPRLQLQAGGCVFEYRAP